MGCSSSATMRKMNMRLVTVEVVVNSGRLVAMSKRERERERDEWRLVAVKNWL